MRNSSVEEPQSSKGGAGNVSPHAKKIRGAGATSTMLENPSDGQIDFLKDRPGHQTWGRRIAMFLASRFTWYNPHLGETEGPNGEEPPSLAKAWAYFEHVTLERYVVHGGYITTNEQELTSWQRFISIFRKGDRRLNIAEPGERELKTKLYNPLTTPLSQLGDFGLGYGIYFSTLRAFGVLCFLAGLLNLVNIFYFASEEYSGDKGDMTYFLKGSAICTNRSWVPCPTCFDEYYYQIGTFSKYREASVYRANFNASGEWVNVTDYVDWTGVNSSVDDIYSGDTSVFTEETLVKFEDDFGITVNDTDIIVDGYYSIPCSYYGYCLWQYCECQIESDTDCYCKFGALPFANVHLDVYSFAEKNNCEGATYRTGFVNMGTVVLFLIGAIVIHNRQSALTVQFDEDEQTAQDYSICVLNPPPDAHDPNEWKQFFEENFNCHVTVCTVDVDNDNIIQLLVKRREILESLEQQLPGIELTDKNIEAEAKRDKAEAGWCGSANIYKLFRAFKRCDYHIREALREKRELPTSSVFVTFETEKSQREVLKWLSVGSIAAHCNSTSQVADPRHLFRGRHVLEVIEPEEPSAIRWQEMNTSRILIGSYLLFTTALCLLLIAIAFIIIMLLYPVTPFLAPLVTTCFTSIFPMFAKWLMNMERHRSESSKEKWLFIKIAGFNILITAVLISVVNPFTASLDQKEESIPGLISGVHALFIAQLGFTPAFQLADPFGNLNRHFFAPRAKTQTDMNRKFAGAVVYLAERYANLIKYLFLIVWYCALYPAAFFMGSFALFIVYFTDRFSLMRSWARTPQLGTQISDFARNYFTPAALALMAVLSSYTWSGFPFDNLCEVEDTTLDPEYIQDWTINIQGFELKMFGQTLFKEPDILESLSINEGSKVYKYCLQDFRAYFGERSFPPLPKFQEYRWMTDDQEDLLNIYCWFAVGVLGCVCFTFVIRNVRNLVAGITGGYKPRGEDMGINYSSVKSIDTYVPSYKRSFGYPLLLCDVSEIDPNLFSWTDPERPHSHYDITKDISKIVDPNKVRKTHVFGKVKHWPPSGRK